MHVALYKWSIFTFNVFLQQKIPVPHGSRPVWLVCVRDRSLDCDERVDPRGSGAVEGRRHRRSQEGDQQSQTGDTGRLLLLFVYLYKWMYVVCIKCCWLSTVDREFVDLALGCSQLFKYSSFHHHGDDECFICNQFHRLSSLTMLFIC